MVVLALEVFFRTPSLTLLPGGYNKSIMMRLPSPSFSSLVIRGEIFVHGGRVRCQRVLEGHLFQVL